MHKSINNSNKMQIRHTNTQNLNPGFAHGTIPLDIFRVHSWRRLDCTSLSCNV